MQGDMAIHLQLSCFLQRKGRYIIEVIMKSIKNLINDDDAYTD